VTNIEYDESADYRGQHMWQVLISVKCIHKWIDIYELKMWIWSDPFKDYRNSKGVSV